MKLPDRFIHMGSKINLDKMMPIKNIRLFPKPEGGIWTAPYKKDEKGLSDWHRWCINEDFIDYTGKDCSIITLKKNSKIAVINSQQDAIKLYRTYRQDRDENLQKLGLSANFIDFEKLALDYDAIYLTEAGEADTRYRFEVDEIRLFGWDVETLLILRADCIDTIEYIICEK